MRNIVAGFRTLLLLVLTILLGVATMWGQTSSATGAIQGLAQDPSGAAVPGATVTLTNSDTAVVAGTVKTGTDGRFVFALLAPATYRIEVQAPGFNTSVLSNVVVEITKVTSVRAQLKMGQVQSVVTVSAAAQMVDVTTATTGTVLQATQIQALPLPTRNFLDLTTLQAGVSATMQSAAVVGAGSPTLEVAGQRSINNNFVLDGIDANDFHNNGLGTAPIPNPDAVAEFRVNTSMYDASQGRASGGVINSVIRSGTAQFHGELFEFNRNTDYNANDYFFNAAGRPRPDLKQNQFGGTVGGPIPKLHNIFWFFSFQGTRQINGVSSAVSGSQPVLPARSGQTAAQYTTALARAFGVPAASIDPVAVNVLLAPGQYEGYLFASGSCPCPTPGIGSIAISLPTQYTANQYVSSIDHQITSSDRLSFKYFANYATELEPVGGATLGQGENLPANNYHLAINDAWTLTPHMVNQFDVGYSYVRNGTFPLDKVTLQDIGETKWDSSFNNDIPEFAFPGGADARSFGGRNTNGSVHGGSASISLDDTLSWTHGKHTLRFGVQIIRYRWNYENDYAENGEIEFPSFNDFLTGTPELLFVSTGVYAHGFRDLNVSEFAQDDYQVTQRLTLDIGLRYDYVGWPHDSTNTLGVFDPSLISPSCVAGGGGSCMQAGFIGPPGAPAVGTPGVRSDFLNHANRPVLGPRIGFAYDVIGNGKLSVRGGYGIFNIVDSGIPALQLFGSPPALDQYNAHVSGEHRVLASPWPAGLLLPSAYPAVPPVGQFEGRFNANGTPQFLDASGQSIPAVSFYSISRNLKHSYNQQWNLDVEYSPAKDWLVELGYIGSHAVRLLDEDVNNMAELASPSHPFLYSYTPPGGGSPVVTKITTNSAANAALRVPLIGIGTGGNTQGNNGGFSFYDGMIAELRHSFSRGFQVNVDYTWSKSIDDVSGIGGFALNPEVPSINKSVSDFNEPQRLVFTYVWNLPGPKTGWALAILGGWETSGAYTIQSGLPFTVTSSSGGTLAGLSGAGSANVASCSGPVVTPGSVGSNLHSYLNRSCFARVPTLASGTAVTGFTPLQGPGTGSFTLGPTGRGDPGTGSLLGDGPRNVAHGPRDQDWDMALMKNIPMRKLGEAVNLQFRAEAFKVFNNVNFSNPSANINSSTFGFITSTLDKTGRILQLALKLSF